MGSAVGRAVSAMDHLRGIRRGTTLRNGSVTPIDGNKFVQRECKKLEKKLPGKMVEMIRDFALDPRYIEEATMEPGMIEEDMGNGTFAMSDSRAYKEISRPTVHGEAKAGGSCYPVVARYRNGLRRTVNLAWGTDIYVCSTGQSFEDLDTAMRCQNDYVKGMSRATLELRYPMQPIPV